MSQSSRLYVARLWDEYVETQRSDEYEYAVVADADIVGELDDGPVWLAVWQMGAHAPGQERWLCLRIRYPEPTEEERERRLRAMPRPDTMSKKAREQAFYHGGGPAEEVVAFASLFLRRRLKLGPEVRISGRPVMLDRHWNQPEGRLSRGQTNLSDLSSGMDLVKNLETEFHLPFVLAARLYQQALQQEETAPDLAYLSLVSAIEAISNRQDIGALSLADHDEVLAELTEQIKDSSLRTWIADRLLETLHQDRIRLRFVKFIVSHVESEFWDESGRSAAAVDATEKSSYRQWLQVKPEQLEELMTRVYRQRSKTLHEGRPFPPWINSSYDIEEMPGGLGMSSGDGAWDASDYFPHLSFMERLTRHVLVSFLKRNQRDVASPLP